MWRSGLVLPVGLSAGFGPVAWQLPAAVSGTVAELASGCAFECAGIERG